MKSSRRRNTKPSPSPADIAMARAGAGHTQTQAAETVCGALRSWQEWEAGTSRMHPGLFDLYKIKTACQK